MTTTNRQGLIVFSENIEKLNTVLAELQVSLSKQEELVKLNRESTKQIADLKQTIQSGSESVVAQLEKTATTMSEATITLGADMKEAMTAQSKGTTNSIKVSLSSMESSVTKAIKTMDKKVANNKALNDVALSQNKTKGELQSLKKQTTEIRKLLETQQNRITFP